VYFLNWNTAGMMFEAGTPCVLEQDTSCLLLLDKMVVLGIVLCHILDQRIPLKQTQYNTINFIFKIKRMFE
jgi:hypothetical protein